MRLASRRRVGTAECDMTPMIDMTFQLVAFLMVMVNFSEADQNELIRLPSSELAKPPDAPLPTPITLQMTSAGKVIFGPDTVNLGDLQRLLIREKQMLEYRGETARNATIIIRGDRAAKTGKVQELMEVCQRIGFANIVLRAKQELASRETER